MIIQCFSVKSNVNLPDLLLMPCLFFSLYKKILVLLRKARFGRIRSNLKIAEKVAEFLNPSLSNSLSSSTYFWIFDVNSPLLNRLSSTCFFYLDANQWLNFEMCFTVEVGKENHESIPKILFKTKKSRHFQKQNI